MQCWHLKQERWKTTPSVESWSIGYTVLVHTLHFCCVPLNILPRSSCSVLTQTLAGCRGRRSARDLRARERSGLGLRALGNGRRGERTPPPWPRLYTQETGNAIKQWNYDGFVSPSSLANASLLPRRKGNASQQQTSDERGRDG